jgi:threonine dehydrogenase-like Zn-dependent dehydrogenase
VILGERQAGLVDAPDPRPENNWALVKVHVTPMCTEYKSFMGGRRVEYLGHEAAGEVVEVARPCRVSVGDRVVVQPQYPCGKCRLCVAGDYIHCQHCVGVEAFTGSREGRATYAQYVLKPDWLLSPIPDGMSYERAGLAICGLGPSFGAFDAMALDAFDTVLITGLGPVGLGAVVNARFRGARVIAVDSVPFRVAKAKAMGAEAVLDPSDEELLETVRDLTEGVGVDCALDCSGTVAAERLCLDATRRKGHVAYVGECGQDFPIRISPDLIRTGITIHGSWHYNLNLYPQIAQVLAESPVIDELISHVLPMSEVQRAFELCASHETAKVILRPWD